MLEDKETENITSVNRKADSEQVRVYICAVSLKHVVLLILSLGIFLYEKDLEGNMKDFFSLWSELNCIDQSTDSGKIMNFCLVTENYRYLGNLKTWRPMEEYSACI